MTTNEPSGESGAQPPVLKIINADATPEEVAALVALLLTHPQTPATPGEEIPSEWPVINRLRGAHQVRPQSWRASALPR